MLLGPKPSVHQKHKLQIFTLLQVLDVFTGKNGLLQDGSHLRPWLFIDSSTVNPQTSRKISTHISKCLLKENKGFVQSKKSFSVICIIM